MRQGLDLHLQLVLSCQGRIRTEHFQRYNRLARPCYELLDGSNACQEPHSTFALALPGTATPHCLNTSASLATSMKHLSLCTLGAVIAANFTAPALAKQTQLFLSRSFSTSHERSHTQKQDPPRSSQLPQMACEVKGSGLSLQCPNLGLAGRNCAARRRLFTQHT